MNKIITVTGGDLRGKATQAKLLAKTLGCPLLSFPDYNAVSGQLVRAALTNSEVTLTRERYDDNDKLIEDCIVKQEFDKSNPYHFQCLQMLARIERQDEIKRRLVNNHIVMDRYDVDALVYGFQDGCDMTWLKAFLRCIVPSDIVMVLDGPKFSRDEVPDANELDTKFQQNIVNRYRHFAGVFGWHIIPTYLGTSDISESISITHTYVVNAVNKGINGDIKPLTYEEIKSIIDVKK